MKGSKLALAQASAKIQTAGTAMAALDVATTTLARARELVFSGVQAHNMSAPVGTFFGLLTGTEQQMRDDLHDHVTIVQSLVAGYAARFKGYADDDLDEEISTLLSMQVANALQRANSVLNDVIDWVNNPDEFDFVGGVVAAIEAAIAAAGKVVNHVAQAAGNLASSVVTAFWVPLTVVGLAGGAFLLWRSGALKKATGA
jgi:hypothetical protein